MRSRTIVRGSGPLTRHELSKFEGVESGTRATPSRATVAIGLESIPVDVETFLHLLTVRSNPRFNGRVGIAPRSQSDLVVERVPGVRGNEKATGASRRTPVIVLTIVASERCRRSVAL